MDKSSVVGRPWGARHSAVRALTHATAAMGRTGEPLTGESLTKLFLQMAPLYNVPSKTKGDILALIDETFAVAPTNMTTTVAMDMTPTVVEESPVVPQVIPDFDDWLSEVSTTGVVSDSSRLQKESLRQALDTTTKSISDGSKSPIVFQWDVVEVSGVHYLRVVTRKLCFREKDTDTVDTCYNVNGDRAVFKTAVARMSRDVSGVLGFKGRRVSGVLFAYLLSADKFGFSDGSHALRMWVNKRGPAGSGDVGAKLYITPTVEAPYFMGRIEPLKK